MSSALYDSVARIARHEASARAIAGVGKVTDIFPADGPTPDYAVTVVMRDTGLVLPRAPVATGLLGAAVIPAVDELVVVVFMDGDFNAPVVVGRLYHPDQDPPEHKDGQLILWLPSGTTDPKLKLAVEGKTPSIKLELPDGEVLVEIVEKQVQIKVAEVSVTVQSSGGGRAEIAAGGSTITLKKDGDITIKTSGKLKLDASEIDLTGSAKVKLSAAQVEVN
jgi:phage baseplate assembly protein gpV